MSARFGLHRDDRGAAAVELALVISILFLLLFGIVQFGLAYHVHQGIQAAAREGARIASLPDSTSDQIAGRVTDALSLVGSTETCPSPGVDEYCVTITPASARPCFGRSGQQVAVDVASKVRILIPLWDSPEVTLNGRGVFRCE